MECKTARVFLGFIDELGPDEADDLRAHLADCCECDAAARAEARLDAHLGKAMRDVPVPAGLRGRIDDSLAAGRAVVWRKLVMGYARPLAYAASLLLLAGVGGLLYRELTKRPIYPETIHQGATLFRVADADAANAELARLGFAGCSPTFVKYAYLSAAPSCGLVPGYPNIKAPVFHFADGNRRAIIYVIDTRRNPLVEEGHLHSGYAYRAEVEKRKDFAYVVLYTGDDWNWLFQPDDAE